MHAYVEDVNAWVDILGLSGTYIFTDGKISYIGKGPKKRMKASMTARIGGTQNSIASLHRDFGNDDIGFMVEYKLMEHYEARTSASFANSSKIDSPGKKKYDNADGKDSEGR